MGTGRKLLASFSEENNRKKSHPSVQCNYCSKVFDRAVSLRMQTHLDKECLGVPDNAKSKQNVNLQGFNSTAQNITPNITSNTTPLNTPTNRPVK
ncbi:hypothetical protein C1645_839280 [Glomus cerebriforme]|uniref:BED-type domain-containing protein n=1 Tax=Glomus cerebriforme TaxID=658196 RepID=A0A397S704_9GLOM|nr:hypothetical protein C1645_839280 [Glomus cerebriforme]